MVAFRTAIEAEILYQALYVHVQRLNTSLTKCQTRYCMEPRPSVDDCKVMRFLGAVIKPVHPCTGLIARFAQQNALLLRTTDIRVGTEKKTPWEQNSSGKKIEAVWCSGADRRSFEASAVLHFVFFIVIVNKMQQSAKESCLLKRNTAPEVFPLTAILAGSGKTMPFEKRLFPSVHPCTPGNDEICGIHKSRFCLVSRTSVSVLKLQGDRKKINRRHGKKCTSLYIFYLRVCRSKHATDMNHRHPWRF